MSSASQTAKTVLSTISYNKTGEYLTREPYIKRNTCQGLGKPCLYSVYGFTLMFISVDHNMQEVIDE